MKLDISKLIGLDFETYSAVDLFKHGLERYVSDPTFMPLMAHIRTPQGIKLSYDFVLNPQALRAFKQVVFDRGYLIAGHNVGFEERVLQQMGIVLSPDRFIDSAAVARACGVAGKLEAAAPQLLNHNKLETGKAFIQMFCIPGPYQISNNNLMFDPQIVRDNMDAWNLGHDYCQVDADLSRDIVKYAVVNNNYTEVEHSYEVITRTMNQVGWHVDVPMVEEMNRRYLENKAQAEQEFRSRTGAHDLNLGSLKQLKEWCLERGIKASSFDEKKVEQMIRSINKRITKDPDSDKAYGYHEVQLMLTTKQILGGSSLKKLEVILNTTDKHGILRDQYVHIGAGQSYRTTGRSVQMQNLKRIGDSPDPMEELTEGYWSDEHQEFVEVTWDNEQLARNLRQVFTSRDPNGFLIVGDFKSVEARGLAWLAQESEALTGYRLDLDAYKVLAASMFNKDYDDVTKPERQAGKVGVLSCGYGAGPDAVQSFAKGMGIELSEGEAASLVTNWRNANPKVVDLWDKLDKALHRAVELGVVEHVDCGDSHSYMVQIEPVSAPASLLDQTQTPGLKSLLITFHQPGGKELFRRYFHGVYAKGRQLIYFKPTETKNGNLWKDWFINPKTHQKQDFSIYGGKLTGIITQSMCREIFFASLMKIAPWIGGLKHVDIVGQFHDEIVIDWRPGCDYGLRQVENQLDYVMSTTDLRNFPLGADIKHDYRYTK